MNNSLLVLDRIVIPSFDFRMARSLVALAGAGLLLYGLIWGTPE